MNEPHRHLLDDIDADRRATLAALLRGAVFVAPVVATYGLAGRTGLITAAANMTAL